MSIFTGSKKWMVLIILCGVFVSGEADSQSTPRLFQAGAKWEKIKSPPQRVSSDLIRMKTQINAMRTDPGKSSAEVDTLQRWVKHVDGLPELEIRLQSSDPAAVEAASRYLAGIGMDVTSVSQKYGRIYGTIDLSRLDALNDTPHLSMVHPNYLPIRHSGSVESEGDAAMESRTIRDAYGLHGTGVTIGIMSDSFEKRKSSSENQHIRWA